MSPAAASVTLFFLAAASVCAPLQPSGEQKVPAKPEIHGVVIEPGTLQPVTEAEVLLFKPPAEFALLSFNRANALAATTTDANGAFRFSLEQFGSYRVEVKKEGYISARPFTMAKGLSNVTTVKVHSERPTKEVRLLLAHPGQLTGHVVDEETRNPIAKLQVWVGLAVYSEGRRAFLGRPVETDSEGNFVAGGLEPGEYVVWTQPRASGYARIMKEFSKKDLDAVDMDYESAYWPGGGDLNSALAVGVGSGVTTDMGRLMLRRVPYYRVRVSLPVGSCKPGEKAGVGVGEGPWKFTGLSSIPCDRDFLMRSFAPGSYKLEVVAQERPRESRVRGVVPVEILDKNVSVLVPLVRGVDVEGRVGPVEGAGKPILDKMRVYPTPVAGSGYSDEPPVTPDEQGRFRLANLRPPEQRVNISGVPESHYIKEIRYNGIRVRGNTRRLNLQLDSSAMAHSLEIVVDDKPASLTGSVMDRDRAVSEPYVVLVPWPPSSPEALWPVLKANGDEDGKFKLAGLAPGEYRILAVSPAVQEKLSEPNVLERLLANAKTITLGAGAFQTVPLELTEIR